MKILRLHSTGDLRIHKESVPFAGSSQKLIRVRSVGICGSDLHWFAEGGTGDAKLVFVLPNVDWLTFWEKLTEFLFAKAA